MDVRVVINQMVILFFIMAVGYIANKAGVMTRDTNKLLSSLVINVTLPFYIISSVLTGEHSLANTTVFAIIGYSVISYAVVTVIALLLTNLPCFRGTDRKLYCFMIMFGNVGFMGMPVVSSIFGGDSLFFASVFNMPFNFLVYSLGVYFVSGGGSVRISPKLFLNAGVISSILAILLYIFRVTVPEVICSAISLTGQITTPAAMLVIGSTLAGIPVKHIFRHAQLYLIAFIRLILVPLAVWAVLRLFIDDSMLLGVGVMLSAMPVATNAAMLCLQYNGNYEIASDSVFISTVLSIVTIPLLAWLLF